MISRRDFLKMAGMGTGAALLNACVQKGTPPLAGLWHAPTATLTATATATNFPSAKSSAPTAAVARKLCFVLWDHQLAQYDYKPRNLKNPVPETCPLYSGAKNPLTPAWEAYWRNILHLCNPTMKDADFEGAWNSLVASDRAFTNSTGPETGDFALHSITCGGATHEMVTGVPEGQHMRIYTLNSKKDPPLIPAKPEQIDITRHFFATTGSNTLLPDGTYAVNGFPQFENCIVPLVSPADTDLIDVTRIKVVSSIMRPYNP